MYHFLTTLRFRLILLVFLAILPALGLILYSGLEQRRLAAAEARKDVLDIVHHASAYQERLVEGVRQMLATLAELPAVRQQDSAACNALFARILEKQKILGNISAINLHGTPFASALPQPPKSQLGRSHFDRVLQTKEFSVGEYGIGRASGKPTIHFGYPIINNGEVIGVVTTSVILDYLGTLVAKTPMPPGAMVTVIDRDGTVLARHPQPEKWLGKRLPETEIIKIVVARGEGITEAVGLDGALCIFAFAPLAGGSQDLFVYAGEPIKTVYAGAHYILTRNLLALGGVTVLALLVAWILGQLFLVGRTHILVDRAEQMAGGDLTVRSDLSYQDGEFGQLAGAFDRMAEALQQRDQAIRESEAKYRALIETTHTGYVIVDPQGKVLDANQEYLRLTGYKTLPEILGRNVVEWTVASDLQRNAAAVQECAEKGFIHNLEIAYVQTNGETVPIEINATFIQDEAGKKILSLVRDITIRKRGEAALRAAEEALEDRERFLSSIFDSIQDGISIIDPELNILRVNRAKERDHAHAMPLVGKKCYEAFLETSEPCPLCPVRRTLETGKNDQEIISVKLTGKEGVRHLNLFTFPLIDKASGKLTGVVKYSRDITEQMEAEKALRESEKRFRDITENAAEWVWEVDAAGKYTYASPVVEKLLGYSPDEMLDKHFCDLVVPEHRDQMKAAALAVFAAKQHFRDFPNPNLHKNGEIVWLSTSAVPVLDDQGNLLGYRGCDIDITGRRKAQESLEAANTQLKGLVLEAEERNRQMAAFNEMSEALQSCLTSEEAFGAIGHFVPKFFSLDAGALYLFKSSKNILTSVMAWGDPQPTEEMFPPQDCWAIRSGRPHLVPDPNSGLLCRHVPGTLSSGYLCVPLVAQGESLGILHIRLLSCAITAGEDEREIKQRLTVAVAENLALALANLKLRETLQNQAIRDPLTGLYNRRYLEETMDRELHRARRQEANMGVVMMDLDHFKAFNDTFGHAAGDILLSAVANVMKNGIREEDVACRYGGEEFLLLMPGTSLSTAKDRAETLRQAIKNLQVKYDGRFLKATSISLGVALFPNHGTTASELIAAADAALYHAKQAGRDRVELAGENPPETATSPEDQ